MKAPNILITNSVPLNGGDEALLRATTQTISRRWPLARVSVACRDVELASLLLPDLALMPDLEFANEQPASRTGKLRKRAAKKIEYLGFPASVQRLLPQIERHKVRSVYAESDLVVSAPGGFLNDHYDLTNRLDGFELALGLGRPVVLFGQSVGPFWKPESIERVGRVLNRVTAICLRDSASRGYLTACGIRDELMVDAADAAFLWRGIDPSTFRARSGRPQTIAMCFRNWPPKSADSTTIVKAASTLSRALLANDPARRLRFLSTCQGVPGYIDDSSLALDIVGQLSPGLSARCEIDRTKYSPSQLIRQYGRCDAYIGMRLHGAILSMLGGTPAFGLGYEPKTREVFGQMGLEKFNVDFTADVSSWISGCETMLSMTAEIHSALPATLDEMAARANRNVEAVARALPTDLEK